MKTEINLYGNLTVENIETFLNNEIAHQEKNIERFQNAKHDDPYEAHLLHENLVRFATLNELKRRFSMHDLNLECKK